METSALTHVLLPILIFSPQARYFCMVCVMSWLMIISIKRKNSQQNISQHKHTYLLVDTCKRKVFWQMSNFTRVPEVLLYFFVLGDNWWKYMKKRIVRIHNKNLINTLTHTFWLMVVCKSCFGKWTKRIQHRIN